MKNISLNIDKALGTVTKEQVYAQAAKANECNATLQNGNGAGNDFLGWLHLPSSITDAELTDIENTANVLRSKCEVVVAIGIGGSYLGTKAVVEALNNSFDWLHTNRKNPVLVYAGHNIGEDYLYELCEILKGKQFGLINISKSGTTTEPALAFRMLKKQLEDAVGKEEAKHRIVAITDAKRGALRTLADQEGYKTFIIPDNVGGRFSVWGAIGLPVAIALGADTFKHFLAGAHAMDQHASTAPLQNNLPALMAMFAYWNSEKLDVSSYCFLPYDERLRVMVDWLQQLEMESLGKSTAADGTPVIGKTSLAVWGGHGNESQHSFYQFLREGTAKNAIDVFWCEKPGHAHKELHRVLMANAKAQTEALVTRDPKSKYFNVVSTVSIEELTPETLGALMAMYEHKTTMLGTLFGINAFDQPGVELGKKLANEAYKKIS